MSTRSSMSTQGEDEKVRKVRLTAKDYRIIVGWIEDPVNLAMIYGADGKTKVGDKTRTTKIKGFDAMAKHFNARTTNPNLLPLSGRQLQQRWDTLMKNYRKTARRSVSETGLGLTEAEMGRGMTIEDKLHQLCPLFRRMDDLFGTKANVRPAVTLALGTVPPAQHAHMIAPHGDAAHGQDDEDQDDSSELFDFEDLHSKSDCADADPANDQDGRKTHNPASQQIADDDEEHVMRYGFAAVTARLAAAEAAFDSEPEENDTIVIEATPPSSPLPSIALDELDDPFPQEALSLAQSFNEARNEDTSPQDAVSSLKKTTFKPPARSITREPPASTAQLGKSATTKRADTTGTGSKMKAASQRTKRKHDGSDDDKTKSPNKSKKQNVPRPSAQESRLSVTQSYAKSSEARAELMERRFEEERRQWEMKIEMDRELRREEMAERRLQREEERALARAQARQQTVLELVRQKKTPEEIAAYLEYLP